MPSSPTAAVAASRICWVISSRPIWIGTRISSSSRPVVAVSSGSRLLLRTISIRSCRATAFRVSPSRMSSSLDWAPRSSRNRWKKSNGSVMRQRA